MTTIQSGIPINQAGVRSIDMSKLKSFNVAEGSKELYDMFVGGQKRILEARYSSTIDPSRNPTYGEYAQIQVNGKTVAKIDNHGWVEMSNAGGGSLKNLPSSANGYDTGPLLAEERAAYIADLLGGNVVKSSTAMTQKEFNGTAQPRGAVDYGGMKKDPLFQQLQKTITARTLFLAQQFSQDEQRA